MNKVYPHTVIPKERANPYQSLQVVASHENGKMFTDFYSYVDESWDTLYGEVFTWMYKPEEFKEGEG